MCWSWGRRACGRGCRLLVRGDDPCGSVHPTRAEPSPTRKGGPLLAFLIVCLVLVGILDLILWICIGYVLLAGPSSGSAGDPAPRASASGGAVASTAPADEEDAGEEGREALLAYIQDMAEPVKLENAFWESQNSAWGNGDIEDTDAAYAELSERAIPLCRQLNEAVQAISPGDPDISAIHALYLDCAAKALEGVEAQASALNSQDADQFSAANDLIDEANEVGASYAQALQALARERGVDLNG